MLTALPCPGPPGYGIGMLGMPANAPVLQAAGMPAPGTAAIPGPAQQCILFSHQLQVSECSLSTSHYLDRLPEGAQMSLVLLKCYVIK